MSGDLPGQPSAQVPSPVPTAAEPEPAGSPTTWKVDVSDRQDRWTLRLPENTLQVKKLQEYVGKHGKEPASLQDLPKLPKYVKVTATRRAKRKKRSVLKTELIKVADRTSQPSRPQPSARTSPALALFPSNQLRFRLAGFNTTANRLNIAAVSWVLSAR